VHAAPGAKGSSEKRSVTHLDKGYLYKRRISRTACVKTVKQDKSPGKSPETGGVMVLGTARKREAAPARDARKICGLEEDDGGKGGMPAKIR